MKVVGFVFMLLFFSKTTVVEEKTIRSQIEIDGEIHKQNIINSVEDFLKEMNIDPDSVYVPFRNF